MQKGVYLMAVICLSLTGFVSRADVTEDYENSPYCEKVDRAYAGADSALNDLVSQAEIFVASKYENRSAECSLFYTSSQLITWLRNQGAFAPAEELGTIMSWMRADVLKTMDIGSTQLERIRNFQNKWKGAL